MARRKQHKIKRSVRPVEFDSHSWMFEEYKLKGRSTTCLAAQFGVDVATVHRALKRLNIETHAETRSAARAARCAVKAKEWEMKKAEMAKKRELEKESTHTKLEAFHRFCYRATPREIERAHDRLCDKLPSADFDEFHSDTRDQTHRFVTPLLSGASIQTPTTINTIRFGI